MLISMMSPGLISMLLDASWAWGLPLTESDESVEKLLLVDLWREPADVNRRFF
jgi:hypothetical protein